VGYHSDISERKQSEEKLRISEARYRELFDSNPLPSWIYSPDNLQILDANQAAMDYYGWPRDQFLGMSVSSMRMPGEPETSEGESKRGRAKPWRYRAKNKRGMWVEPTTYEIEAAGGPARLMMVKDVTDHVVYQTKMEQAQRQLEGVVAQKTSELQTSKAQCRALTAVLPQFVWSARPDGFFDYCSNQWAEYTGLPLAELMGAGWLDTLHSADRAQAQSCWLTALENGGCYDVDYRIRAKDGTYRWFEAHGIAVRAPDGEIAHWMGTSSDKEDRKLSKENQGA
jgi:PAS domain S-box-containing protein